MIDQQALDELFFNARTHNAWQPKTVDTAVLRKIYDAAKMGPTSANCSPLRVVYLVSDAEKQKLEPHLLDSNKEKTMQAPVVALLAADYAFYDHLPFLFPHTDAKSWFAGNEALIAETAMRNSSLQAAYFMLAARAYGLDCGPMSGFNQSGVNEAFFADKPTFKVNFICNLGYGDPAGLFPRSPRFDFDQACEIR